jgi:putative hemolysin
LETITESDGSQSGLCVFEDYACDTWAYYRNECDIEGDAQKVREL